MSDTINYGNLMHAAMRGLIQKVLEDVAANGLPGDHHFFLTFDTLHEDVAIANWLMDRFPEEMTIVVQNWFEDLLVTDQGFSITLNFGDAPETLYVPYDALKTFVDPSVEFGLRFENQDGESTDETKFEVPPVKEVADPTKTAKAGNKKQKADKSKADTPDTSDIEKDADVVSLDSFRK